MLQKKRSENGQMVLVLAIAVIGLIGGLALSIDLGVVLAERRNAQSASDAAALAAGLGVLKGKTNLVSEGDGYTAASNNGFTTGGSTNVSVSIAGLYDGVESSCTRKFRPFWTTTVHIRTTSNTSFLRFLGRSAIENQLTSVSESTGESPAFPGFAIIALGNCLTEGGHLLGITGGGNRASIETSQGGIFLNTPENPSNFCAMDSANSNWSTGIRVHDNSTIKIISVGSYDYAGVQKIYPTPIGTISCDGAPIGDPLEEIPEPVCDSAGTKIGGVFQPGNWEGDDITGGTYAPGIYCIDGDIHLAGQQGIDASSGVVFNMKNGELLFTGQAGMTINAPNESNGCYVSALKPGDQDPKNLCTYQGIAIFSNRTNTNTIEVRGNGTTAVTGTVYAPNGIIKARGGGVVGYDTVVHGQLIAKRIYTNGDATLMVIYNNEAYQFPAILELIH